MRGCAETSHCRRNADVCPRSCSPSKGSGMGPCWSAAIAGRPNRGDDDPLPRRRATPLRARAIRQIPKRLGKGLFHVVHNKTNGIAGCTAGVAFVKGIAFMRDNRKGW